MHLAIEVRKAYDLILIRFIAAYFLLHFEAQGVFKVLVGYP